MNLEHALHNEEACNHLQKVKGFEDWILTTAFYSSLHFVNHKLFPMKVGGVNYTTFNTYYANVVRKSSKAVSKHTAIIYLLNSSEKEINKEYKWLFDACHTARYSDYKVSPAIAKTATDYLQKIKLHCTKKSK